MSRAFRQNTTQNNNFYPQLLGTRGAVAPEHYLSTKAGACILGGGRRAVDVAVGATFVEGVVNPQIFTLGGDCPMLICMAETNQEVSVNGNTMAPEKTTP